MIKLKDLLEVKGKGPIRPVISDSEKNKAENALQTIIRKSKNIDKYSKTHTVVYGSAFNFSDDNTRQISLRAEISSRDLTVTVIMSFDEGKMEIWGEYSPTGENRQPQFLRKINIKGTEDAVKLMNSKKNLIIAAAEKANAASIENAKSMASFYRGRTPD